MSEQNSKSSEEKTFADEGKPLGAEPISDELLGQLKKEHPFCLYFEDEELRKKELMDRRSRGKAAGRWNAKKEDDLAKEEKKNEARRKKKADTFPVLMEKHVRLRRFQRGEVLMVHGDYGHSAFVVQEGTLHVHQNPDNLAHVLDDRAEAPKAGIWESIRSLLSRHRHPEVREASSQTLTATDRSKIGLRRIDLSAVTAEPVRVLKEKNVFGEMAAFTRAPRSATIVAFSDVTAIEIRWQALRDMCRLSPRFENQISQVYRDNAIEIQLLKRLDQAQQDDERSKDLKSQVELVTLGHYSWTESFDKSVEKDPHDRISEEPVIAYQDAPAKGIYILASGFARLSEEYNHGEKTTGYLGTGGIFGFDEVADYARTEKPTHYRKSLRALGHVNALFIPAEVAIKHNLLPILQPEESDEGELRSDLLEFLVEQRVINGKATMIIDMDRCTQCDDCVNACAATHDNNPRFTRRGSMQDGYLFPQACMHCQDPVCMIGCPTGAIRRNDNEGEVFINDPTCIGCATCANSCPYDNIQMVPIRDVTGDLQFPRNSMNDPIDKVEEKATKCDLCTGLRTGPACVHACPHDALIRVDMADTPTLLNFFRQ